MTSQNQSQHIDSMNIPKWKVYVSNTILFISTIGWGFTYIASKYVLKEIGQFTFLATRFCLGALLLFLLSFVKWKHYTRTTFQYGFQAGLALAFAFLFQLAGLQRTSPGTTGVISGLFVVIVPFLYFFFAKKPIQISAIIGSLTAFLGLAIFSWDEKKIEFEGVGEVFILIAAFFFALHIVLIDRAYRKFPQIDGIAFSNFQILTVGLVFILPALLLETVPKQISKETIYGFWYNTIVGTVVGFSIQTVLQRYSPPTHVSLIFTFESVFAFLFSWMFYGEEIGARILVGVFLMILGIFITEILDTYKFKLKGRNKLWQSQKRQFETFPSKEKKF
ncbi:MAG: DMT family transporter [Leptospiraceae bacterium]|nr:DMT family transporter [Leptospiraceae bacterium]